MSSERVSDERHNAGSSGGKSSPASSWSEGLRRGESLYRTLAEQLPNVAVMVFDHDLRLIVAIGEALMTYGVSAPDAEGRLVADAMAENLWVDLEQLCHDALSGSRGETEQTSPDGEHYFRVFSRPLHDENGQVWAGLILAQDVTDLRLREADLRKEAERLSDLAHHDELTRLANRTLFHDRLEHALTRARRDGQVVVVIFIDIDRFKTVNDTLGHDAGDQLLKAVAGLLRSGTRAADTVARLGGDEFAVLLEGHHDDLEPAYALHRLRAAFEHPITVEGEELLIRVSAGVASGPRDGNTADELLIAADRAMYQAKDAGGGSVRFFDPRLQERSRDRLRLEAELHHALRRDELVVHYQPAIDLRTGRVISVEALVRWNHPAQGLLPPAAFIPLAEITGQAVEITEWVLAKACEQVRAWEAAGVPPLRVAINSCSRDLNGGLASVVRDVLQRADVSPDRLEIEITERFLGPDDQVADAMLRDLAALGVSIAVDDFGTGYSSLARLRSFPVDVLKIDRTFIAELEEAPAVAETIITLGRKLALTVLAEGVETEFQHQWLKAAGCDAAAGYFFCRPQPPTDITPWLRARAQSSGAVRPTR